MNDTHLKPKRLKGRIWWITRLTLFLPILYFISMGQRWEAFIGLMIMLGMGYYSAFQLKYGEIEKPYYKLWLNIIEAFLSVGVLSYILFIYLKDPEKMIPGFLIGGISLLVVRIISFTIFTIALIRENKPLHNSRFWSKVCKLSIIATTSVYVLDIDNFKEIAMGLTILLLLASSLAYLYGYYRDPDHRKPLSIASQITVSRIVLTPVFIPVFFYDNNFNFEDNNSVFKWLALLMVIVFMATDFLDGYIARKMNEVSTLGKYLDPFSDKISNMTIFMCFMVSGYASVWMIALIYFREASVETLRTLAANEGIVISARRSGKWKTAIQGAGVMWILIGALDIVHTSVPNWSTIWNYYPYAIMSVITIVTMLSGIDYFVSNKAVLKKYL
ncbi:MAG: CDP-diacylglycerol--glycerol-3-phosphate 3-phosphatidyltransferase [Fibrobacterales bacterium]